MNGQDLLKGLGQVDMALVEEAESVLPRRHPQPWLLAACICLALAGTACAVGTLWGVQIGELSTGEEESSYSVCGTVRTVPDADFSQELHQLLEEDWADWWAKSEMERMLSSSLPGAPYREYETWAEGVEFLGVELANPLEEADWLEKTTYNGTLEGKQELTRHCRTSFGGNADGKVVTAAQTAGYRAGEIRLVLRAELRTEYAGETADGGQTVETGAVWTEAVNMYANSIAMPDGQDAALVVSQPRREDSYVSIDAYFIQDGLLYSLSVIGPDGGDEAVAAVRTVLEQALDCFA